MRFLTPSLLLLAACAGGGGDPTDELLTDSAADCDYPQAAEPMALNQPLAAYSWAQSLRADGATVALDLATAFCNSDTSYDWSPHDYMLFVSVPAW
ncbi:MAG: hypothetical protein EP330_16060 [Deltaproteobacteria bacterium]|nr:MAG: hypothetical protein EP330_16060 [Deltaproteobacteria bacterium]